MQYKCEYCGNKIILSKSQSELNCPNCGATLSEDKVYEQQRKSRLNVIIFSGIFITIIIFFAALYNVYIENWIYTLTYEPNSSDGVDFLISDSVINLVKTKDG